MTILAPRSAADRWLVGHNAADSKLFIIGEGMRSAPLEISLPKFTTAQIINLPEDPIG
jgi:hypothetical protein